MFSTNHYYFIFNQCSCFTTLEKEKIIATLDDLVAVASADDIKIDEVLVVLVDIKARLDAALAGELSPEQQAKVDAVFAALADNPDRIQAAIDAVSA